MQAGTKIGGRNIKNLSYVADTTLIAETKEELMSLLIRVKEESERPGLRLNIKKQQQQQQKTKIMASAPIITWTIEGEKGKVVTDFLFLGSKITVDGDCSHEIRRWLLLGREVMTNLDSMLKSKNIYYSADKRLYNQGYGLPSGHVQV